MESPKDPPPTAADLLKDWRANGFLLIGLDGQVSRPYSGGVPDSHRDVPLDLGISLGLSGEQEAEFRKWLDLVRERHGAMRWEKLAPLCPVSEPASSREGGPVRLEFRKLEDGRGNLTALAVFCLDTANNHAMARQLEEERVRHSLQIRDFLALSANPPETAGPFLEDATVRLEALRRQWDGFMAARRHAGGPATPDSAADATTPTDTGAGTDTTAGTATGAPTDTEAANGAATHGARNALTDGVSEGLWDSPRGEGLGHRLFRELHMLKGNAGAFGFDGLAASAQDGEDLLEAMKRPGGAGFPAQQRLAASLSGLRAQLDEIRRAMKLVSGEGQEAMVRILKWKLDRLHLAADAVDSAAPGGRLDPRTRALVDQSRRIPFLSPAYLARKYRNLVDRLALNQGKEVRFRVAANTGEIHPESFSRVDEALVHILRNMVDHGIEPPGEREAAGKGEAEIGLEYVAGDDKVTVRIRDDGRGMDAGLLADRAVSLGLITRAEADSMPERGRLALIFREGFTTRDRSSQVSGRGIGLALAARCIADLGGNISVTSHPGKGTCFTVTLPPL